MAATEWAFYHDAKRKLGAGSFNLDTANMKLALTGSALTGDAGTTTLSVYSQLSAEVTGGAYVAGGKALDNVTWTLSTDDYKFDSDSWVITASSSSITSIKYAVIYQSVAASSGHLLCWSQLSTVQISITTNNTLTINMNAAGIFTLA